VPYLPEPRGEGHIEPRLDQRHGLPTECAHPWQVVILAKTALRTQARAQGSLFRSALDLAYTFLVDS